MSQELPYQLRYIGEPELGTGTLRIFIISSTNTNKYLPPGDKTRPTIVRSSIDVAVTPSIVEFLTELGARLEFEYIARGYMFRKGRMKITVSKIFKVIAA